MEPSRFGHCHFECCISAFKMKCDCCGEIIKKGDYITQMCENKNMTLRARTIACGGFYTPYTGNRWVHLNCLEAGIWTWWKACNSADEINREEEIEEDEDYFSDYSEYMENCKYSEIFSDY